PRTGRDGRAGGRGRRRRARAGAGDGLPRHPGQRRPLRGDVAFGDAAQRGRAGAARAAARRGRRGRGDRDQRLERQLARLRALRPAGAEHLHGLPGGARGASAQRRARRGPHGPGGVRRRRGAGRRVRPGLRPAGDPRPLRHLHGAERDLRDGRRRGGAPGRGREAAAHAPLPRDRWFNEPVTHYAAAPSSRARATSLDLGEFVSASPSSFHAVQESARRLRAAGFSPVQESAPWSAQDVSGARYVIRDGALIAWVAPEGADPSTPWRIVGSHTDSPALKLKPNPELGRENLSQAGVEVYGGPLLNSWLDRELRLAGLPTLRDGRRALVSTPPVLRVPQLAVHLDRSVNKDGLQLDPQRHMQPILGIGDIDVRVLLAAHTEPLDASGHLLAEDAPADPIDPDDIVGLDVLTVDAQAPALFGAHEEFLASARLDNLSSVHAEVQALITLAGEEPDPADGGPAPIALMVANDHEEVGSATRSGAAGPFLEDVLVRMHAALGGDESSRRRALSSSLVLSA